MLKRLLSHIPKPQSWLRTFALVTTAITSAFVMWMGWRLTTILSSPDWCNRAVKASNVGLQPEFAVSGCFSLLKDQINALAWNSHIYAGVIALCLLTLMIVVVAQARASGKVSRDGLEFDVRENIPGEESEENERNEQQSRRRR